MRERGIVLTAFIMLMVVASIAILGVSTFVVQRLSQTSANRLQASTINLAQAGVHHAIYFFRFHDLSGNGYFTLGQTQIDAAQKFTLGGDPANFLMVNTSNAILAGASNQNLQGLTLQNATNSTNIVIDRMVVSWNNARKIREIRINGSLVWTGNKASPADCNISNVVLDAVPNTLPIDFIRFNNDMSGAQISVQFVMVGGSMKGAAVYPASAQFNFTVKSTGKVIGETHYRTVEAQYNALTSTIINLKEIGQEIP